VDHGLGPYKVFELHWGLADEGGEQAVAGHTSRQLSLGIQPSSGACRFLGGIQVKRHCEREVQLGSVETKAFPERDRSRGAADIILAPIFGCFGCIKAPR